MKLKLPNMYSGLQSHGEGSLVIVSVSNCLTSAEEGNGILWAGS
jgi:hypothetical protein